MENKRKILFICLANRNRSRTAHEYYEQFDHLEVRSCGLISDYVAETKEVHWPRATDFSKELFDWADEVYVLDSYCISLMYNKRNNCMDIDLDKMVGCHIDDDYEPNDPVLIGNIRLKLDNFLKK